MSKKLKKLPIWIWIILAAMAGLAIGYWGGYDKGYEKAVKDSISSFQECADAGYPVQESFPEVCRTPDGKIFTKPTTE